MIKELSTKWIEAKEREEAANKVRLAIEIDLYKAIMEQKEIKKEGFTNFEYDGFKINITSRMNVTVDQEKALNAPYLFKTNYEYSKTTLAGLPEEMQDQVHGYITMKPSKPTFKVEVL